MSDLCEVHCPRSSNCRDRRDSRRRASIRRGTHQAAASYRPPTPRHSLARKSLDRTVPHPRRQHSRSQRCQPGPGPRRRWSPRHRSFPQRRRNSPQRRRNSPQRRLYPLSRIPSPPKDPLLEAAQTDHKHGGGRTRPTFREVCHCFRLLPPCRARRRRDRPFRPLQPLRHCRQWRCSLRFPQFLRRWA
jgi:hypothetical protein